MALADPSSADVFWLAFRALFGAELEDLKGVDFDRDMAVANAVVDGIMASPEFHELLIEYVRQRQHEL